MFKSQEYEKKHICPSNNFGCTMLQGLFYCFHLLSVLSSQNEPSVFSHTLPLPFYSQCSPAKDGTSSMHLLPQPATDPILTVFYMHLLKKRDKSEFKERPAASGSVAAVTHFWPLLKVCKIAEAKKSTLLGCELSLLSGRILPLPWISRATYFHYA